MPPKYNLQKSLDILRDLSSVLSGELDFSAVASSASSVLIKHLDLLGIGLYLPSADGHLDIVSFHSKYGDKQINRLFGDQVRSGRISIKRDDNLLAKTITHGKSYESNSIYDFAVPVLTSSQSKVFQRLARISVLRSVPVISSTGEILSVIGTGTNRDHFSEYEKQALVLFAEQLANTIQTIKNHNLSLQSHSDRVSEVFRAIQDFDIDFSGSESMSDVAKSAMEHIMSSLDLVGGSLYQYDPTLKEMRHVLYETNIGGEALHTLLDPHLNNLIFQPFTSPENALAQSIKRGKPITTNDLLEVGKGIIPDAVLKSAQSLARVQLIHVEPLLYKNEPIGVIVLGNTRSTFTEEELSALHVFSKQIALAMGSVREKERILEDFRKELMKEDEQQTERQSVKFTLRITESMSDELARLANLNNSSKADYIRKLLQEGIEREETI